MCNNESHILCNICRSPTLSNNSHLTTFCYQHETAISIERERETELYQRRQKRCFFNWQVVKDLKPPPCAARGRRKVAFKSCFPVRIIIFLCDSFFVELSWGHVALGKYTYSEIISKEGGRVLNMDRAPWSEKWNLRPQFLNVCERPIQNRYISLTPKYDHF